MKQNIKIYMVLLCSCVLAVTNADARTKKKNAATSAEEVASVASTPDIKTTSNSIGMSFVQVPAGAFIMGSRDPNTTVECPADDPFTARNEYKMCQDAAKKKARDTAPPKNETPSHQVTISRQFLIGQYEVTQGQWYAVMGNNPAKHKSDVVGEDSRNFPVENVNWNEVQDFISRLNTKEGKQYRLPTEAEWEYACRSGGKEQEYCGGDDVRAVGWFHKNSKTTHRIGTKQPNGLGIYDMSGNVSEWCQDWSGDGYNGASSSSDHTGPTTGTTRILRGGSLYDDEWFLRSRGREMRDPKKSNTGLGFRLVLVQ